MKTNELRKRFLEFFKKKSHTLFSSDTLVPADKSLLFTSAGMNQFKPYFLGEKKDIKRAVSCQKCLRTGDLERVGKTDYHHTFFEMLGNFSFGDYFKKEAIEFAWEFVTKEVNISKENLWVSVYKDDKQAYSVWKNCIGVPEKKIVKLGEESNYWPANAPSQGPNGVCGPCSEIFVDRGKTIGCGKKSCNPDCSCGRFVEIWNLVFTQFNRVGKNKLEPLPQKNIDTGMGLERMAAVLQGKESNFEIDILQPAVELVQKILKVNQLDKKNKSLIYLIVDHSRAATFAISDGIYPSNEGRGYVIRKIIRKALCNAYLLGNDKPFLYELVNIYGQLMQDAYPAKAYDDILKKKDIISKVIKAEEKSFIPILKQGAQKFLAESEKVKKGSQDKIDAQTLFNLHDTWGFSFDAIAATASNYGIDEQVIDFVGAKKLLKEQQERSRKASMFDGNIFKDNVTIVKGVGIFAGQEDLELETEIVQIFSVKNEKTDYTKEAAVLKEGEEGLINFGENKTPFYPEGGGQLSDKGRIKTKSGEFSVEIVYKMAGVSILHKGKVIKGEIHPGKAAASVDKERRQALARAHSATHLLQAALRKVLGEHVVQQGSLVDEDKFRFDFTHFNRLTKEELEKVGNLVMRFISNSQKVEKKELSLEEAKKQGALAFFKDKYQDKVRVVSISDYSKELCGGTHVDNTSQIGDFEIESETSISSGIRRIRAVVGKEAENLRQALKSAKEQESKSSKEDEKLSQKQINQEVTRQKEQIISQKGDIIGKESINGVNFLFNFNNDSFSSKEQSRIMPLLSDRLKQGIGSVFIFIVRSAEGKDIFICSATDDLFKKGLSCKKFISGFKKELSLTGGGTDKIVRGVVLNMGDDFLDKVKEAFRKFTS
ncbi:MAG: alanine--tRNA ligase [Omnitrophica bacterium]|nr:alanine--tRNA ligase [Candidatus Omnitrophota bacterium]